MDISSFISELLARQNVLIVPGLGTFSRDRVDGYYNKDQQQFYPPSQQILYKNEYTDDDVLASHIAKERHISITSARYFIEKLVAGLLEQVSINTVQFGNMGTFSMRRGQLVFTPGELNETDELFYGLAPVKLKRNNSFRQQAVVIPPKPVVTEAPVEPVAEQAAPVELPPVIEQPATIEDTEEYYEEETAGHKINIWLVLALIIVLIGVGIIATYIYKPALFNSFKPLFGKVANTPPPPPVVKKNNADSLTKDTVEATPAVIKTESITPVDTFRIVVGSWQGLKKATQDAEEHTKQGFNAEVHKAGVRYQVTVATYNNNDSAKAALPIFKEKLKKQDIRIQIYPFKKP